LIYFFLIVFIRLIQAAMQ